jgi:hypothetical protein
MPQIRVIKIVFDTAIRSFEVPAFRGAIIDVVGREHVVFHNHIGNEKLHYAYPLIQYKLEGRHAGIVCIEDGVDEIHHFFSKNTGAIRIGRDSRSLRVESVKINRFQVQVNENLYAYRIKSWLPLNEKNFELHQRMDALQEKLLFLEKILTGNVLSFAKGIGWTVDQPIITKISSMPESHWIKHKGANLMAMNLEFKTNVCLPYDIGLGKGASVGFGTITKKQ